MALKSELVHSINQEQSKSRSGYNSVHLILLYPTKSQVERRAEYYIPVVV
jgi:ppGpp synthetase/RelA/SpoT-type nucleotidyltranferase